MRVRVAYASVKHLDDIDRYIRRYNVRGHWLQQAASDVLDGAVYRTEIKDLISRKLLSVIDDGHNLGPFEERDICGRGWTVYLTQRAMKHFWPSRIREPRARSERR